MRMILAALDSINRAVYYLVGALLAVISVVVFFQVLVRFVLTGLGINISAPWTEEVARYVLVWVILLGAALGCRKAQLIALHFVIDALPAALGRLARYATLFGCIAFFALLFQVGWQFVQVIGRTELSPVMQISKTWVYWAMPVAAALMLVNTLALILEAWLDGKDIRQVGSLASTD